MDLTARRSSMVRMETLSNTAITAIIAALLSAVIFPLKLPIPALAPPLGGILGIWPGSFNFTFLVTIGLTLVTRRRVDRDLYKRLLPEDLHIGAGLPQNLILRAATLALGATILLAGTTTLLFWFAVRRGALNSMWSFQAMLAFYVVYFTVLSWLVTPVIIWRALRD